jgi:NAD(P)-dependent dehydrogenase (short-subunit alcohol dehydrogenase family)
MTAAEWLRGLGWRAPCRRVRRRRDGGRRRGGCANAGRNRRPVARRGPRRRRTGRRLDAGVVGRRARRQPAGSDIAGSATVAAPGEERGRWRRWPRHRRHLEHRRSPPIRTSRRIAPPRQVSWGVTRSMAAQLGSLGIRINAVCPGFVQTAMVQVALNIDGAEICVSLERPRSISEPCSFQHRRSASSARSIAAPEHNTRPPKSLARSASRAASLTASPTTVYS